MSARTPVMVSVNMIPVTDQSPEIAVLLVDDQELVRSGLRRILRRKDGFTIVAARQPRGRLKKRALTSPS